ncbi:MAG: hypothetical protein AB7G28_22800 [Pirellulales bacterium]
MAITLFIGKETGTGLAMSLPVDAVETSTPQVPISQAAAVAALEAEYGLLIPATMGPLSLPDDGAPGIQRLSPHAFRFQVNYRFANVRPFQPPTGSEVRLNFQAVAEPIVRQFAPEVGKFWAGVGTAPSQGGLIGVRDQAFGMNTAGVLIAPGRETFGKELTVPIGTVTGSWIRGITKLVKKGYVNSVTLTSGAYAIGEIQLVRASGQQVSDAEFSLSLGWSYAVNVTGEVRGDVTGIAYKGHEYVWQTTNMGVDRASKAINLKVNTVYVNQVWPTADIGSLVGVEPP